MSNINIITNENRCQLRTRYRYAVYERKLVREDSVAYSRFFIVLKNQYDVIVHFTGFHKYVETYSNNIYRPLSSDTREKLHYICVFLNYALIERYKDTGAAHIFQVNRAMLETFFRHYSLEILPGGVRRGKQSIEKCVCSVTSFFRNLSWEYGEYMAVGKDQLYHEKITYGARGQSRKKLVPSFKVCGIPEHRQIFRDIPTEAFKLLLNQAFKNMPEIAFAICAQAFAGLRPGEAMNLRQEHSPLGRGVATTIIDGRTRSIEFDLTKEYILRSDGVVCGRIKKERRQKVYPAFLPAFVTAYERHKNYLRSIHYEYAYCPMFVNSRGMAMTYADYRNRFRLLIEKYLRPLLLKQEDAECRLFGQLLCENSLGPHSLRHWFSVALVLMGEDIAQLQYWRGDTSPESALSYLQNKGELMRELSQANENFAELLRRGVMDGNER